jgi:hypothetical protein
MDHHGSKLFVVNFFSITFMTDVIILAEIAQEIAMGKKKGTRTLCSYKWRLFAEMRGIAGNFCPGSGLTDPFLIFQPIHTTGLRAEAAIRKESSQLMVKPLDFTFSVSSEVDWFRGFHSSLLIVALQYY